MRDKINDDLKTAMKAGDKDRVGTLRLINSAIKSADIDARPKDKISDADILTVIAAVIKETGAAGPKDMGKVMGALKAKYAGQMDFGKASALTKDLLK